MGLHGRPRLTTTSYAFLGLLALRPWTSQDLTAQTERGLRRFWPRTVSRSVDEPRKLVAAGYATVSTEVVGRSLREEYTITDEGRNALREWLADPAPPPPPALESEHLVRIWLAEQGTRDDLLRTLASLEDDARATLLKDAAIAAEYLDGTAEFSNRAAVSTMVGLLINEQAAVVADWAARSRTTVDTWPEDLSGDLPVDRAALEAVVRRGS